MIQLFGERKKPLQTSGVKVRPWKEENRDQYIKYLATRIRSLEIKQTHGVLTKSEEGLLATLTKQLAEI